MFEIITTNKKRAVKASNYDIRITASEKLEFSPEFFERNSLAINELNYGKVGENYGFQVTASGNLFKKRAGATNKSRMFTNDIILAKLKEYGVMEFTLTPYSEGVFYFTPVAVETVEEVVVQSLNQESYV